MRFDWQVRGDYEEVGGADLLRQTIEEALAALPREHLRQIGALIILDEDPKGKALGIWRQDHTGFAIELYLRPHVASLLPFPAVVRGFALRLHLAYTLFHEVGHHVTRVLNRRAAPPRKAALVEQKIERWADEYAEKRLARLIESWLRPGGTADLAEDRRALTAALRAMRMDSFVTLPEIDTKKEETEGTKRAAPAS